MDSGRRNETEWPNKALHRTAIPLRSIAAGELRRSTASFPVQLGSKIYFMVKTAIQEVA